MSTSEYSESPQASPAAVDAEAVQRAKREIQGIVQQIADLSRQDVAAERYYDEFLNKVVTALAAVGGAVWTRSDAGQLQLAYQINLRETGLIENPIGQEQHGRLLHQVMTGNVAAGEEGALVAPHSGAGGGDDADEHAPANPTDFLLVLAPIANDQGAQGIVEVFQRPGARVATQRGYLRFLLQTCELAGDYLRSRRLRHLSDKQTLWEQLESFTRTAHQNLDVRETSYTIANEGRRLIGCDRVTVAVKYGSRIRLEAISGQDMPDKRSNVATLLTKLAKRVIKTGEDCWYRGDTSDMAPQVEKAIDAYVDESHTKAMAILPLVVHEDEEANLAEDKAKRKKGPPKVLGALIVEQMVNSQTAEGFEQRVDVVRSHSVTAIGNALEHESLFLMPVWKQLGKAMWLVRGRTLPKTLFATAAIGGLIAAALLLKTDFTLEGTGKLRPETMQSVFAQVTGEVDEVRVEHDSVVARGDILLVQRSIDQDKEIASIMGELNGSVSERESLYNETLSSDRRDRQRNDQADREQAMAKLSQVEERIESLQQQLALLRKKEKRLEIRSPIDGKVITWNVRESLIGRPVMQGQKVLDVADPSGKWRVDLLMPEKRMGHVTQAWKDSDGELRVDFIPATQPDKPLQGRVVEIDTTAESQGDAGNNVKLKVEFDQEEFRQVVENPKVGAEVIAKVYCGKQSYAYAWLHDLYNTIQSKILFRF